MLCSIKLQQKSIFSVKSGVQYPIELIKSRKILYALDLFVGAKDDIHLGLDFEVEAINTKIQLRFYLNISPLYSLQGKLHQRMNSWCHSVLIRKSHIHEISVARVKASDTSSMELQHHYTIFCLYASHVKRLYRISDSSAQQQPSKLREDMKLRVLQQGGKEKTGHRSLLWPTETDLGLLLTKGNMEWEQHPPAKGTDSSCLVCAKEG